MGDELTKKYGLPTAISMVVGIVIGSGVFFKAEKVLTSTNGNIFVGILSWVIGGLIMIVCAHAFSILASSYNKTNGITDYAEYALGPVYGYMMSWFLATIYYPTLSAVLSWVSARYLGLILGWHPSSGETMLVACVFLMISFVVNTLSPSIAGGIQVSSTIIKIFPLLAIGIIGFALFIRNNLSTELFTLSQTSNKNTLSSSLFTSIVATSFAYEGWIVATSINSELVNAKKNLPIALTYGTIFIVIIYTLYYLGLCGLVPTDILINDGEKGVQLAFYNVFGYLGSTILYIFVIISCLGTLNGVMLGNSRGFYSFAKQGMGPNPSLFKQIDKKTGIPTNSSIIGLLFSCLWLIYFYGSNITGHWFGIYAFDSSELPVITTYAMYIPIFIMMILREKNLSFTKRFIIPTLAIFSSVFMIIACFYSHGISVIYYLITYAIIMIVGLLIRNSTM